MVAPEICHSPAATISTPAVVVSLVPAARTSSADTGATTAIAPEGAVRRAGALRRRAG